MLDLCLPCKNKGKLRAVYKHVKGVPMCGGCVADSEANPPAEMKPQALQFLEEVKEEKGTTMAKRIDEETKSEILRDSEAGMSISAIAAKHGVSWPTVKNIVGNGTKPAGKKRAGGGDSSPAAKRASTNGASRFADTISQLREERERIDRVIAELERM